MLFLLACSLALIAITSGISTAGPPTGAIHTAGPTPTTPLPEPTQFPDESEWRGCEGMKNNSIITGFYLHGHKSYPLYQHVSLELKCSLRNHLKECPERRAWLKNTKMLLQGGPGEPFVELEPIFNTTKHVCQHVPFLEVVKCPEYE
eukprot:sb/3473785/